jgi:hypothetical protein
VTRTIGDESGPERIHVAVWSSDEDRTLLAAESFGSVGDLQGWFRAYPLPQGEKPTLVWTADLRRDPALARAVSAALGVPLPRRRRRLGEAV